MPKAKTMLDELARTLKARKNAMQRFDRREQDFGRFVGQREPEWYDGNADAFLNAPEDIKQRRGRHMKLMHEAADLSSDLSDRAVMEYDRLMRSNPGKRVMQKAFRMMPGDIVREHDYFDR